MGVPVAVKNDHSVGRLQVQTQTSGPGTEQEYEVLGGGVIERLQQHTSVLSFGSSYKDKSSINGIQIVHNLKEAAVVCF